MNLNEHLVEIIIGAIVALFGAGAVFKFKYSKKKNSENNTTIHQNNNTVTGGDIIAGNKTSK